MSNRSDQVLYPELTTRLCPYCGGRGFSLIEMINKAVPEKEMPSNVVIECKFCAGQGIFDRVRRE